MDATYDAPSQHSAASWLSTMRPSSRLALVSMAVAVLAFFLPWVRLEMQRSPPPRYSQSAASKPSKMATSTKPHLEPKPSKLSRSLDRAFAAFDRTTTSLASHAATQMPRRVTGFQIPRMANHESTRTIMLLVERFEKKREHVGAKSYAVYLLPGLALLFGLLLVRFDKTPWLAGLVGIACLAVAGVGAWKLLTTPLDTPVIAVRIDYGLWVALLAYVGLAGSAAASVLPPKTDRALANNPPLRPSDVL